MAVMASGFEHDVPSNVLQLRNDYARHEAFASLFTLAISRNEDMAVPEVTVVGAVPAALLRAPVHLFTTTQASPPHAPRRRRPRAAAGAPASHARRARRDVAL